MKITERTSNKKRHPTHIYTPEWMSESESMNKWLSGYTHNRQHSRQSFSVVLILWPHFLIINAIWINLFFVCVRDEECFIQPNFFSFICQWEWAHSVDCNFQCDSLHFDRERDQREWNCGGWNHSYANMVSFKSTQKFHCK